MANLPSFMYNAFVSSRTGTVSSVHPEGSGLIAISGIVVSTVVSAAVCFVVVEVSVIFSIVIAAVGISAVVGSGV